jgi:hypothetical protein
MMDLPVYRHAHVRFSVLEVFKGSPAREITIAVYDIDTLPFKLGAEYLIFTFTSPSPNDPQQLYTGLRIFNGDQYVGTDSHEITDPQDPDLLLLRSPSQNVRVYGQFTGSGTSSLDPSQAIVTLTGGDGQSHSWTTSPDDKFNFTFNDVPPGIYTVTAFVPSGLTVESNQGRYFDFYAHNKDRAGIGPPPLTPTGAIPKINEEIISVAPKGCWPVYFTVVPHYDNRIRGRVTDTSGQPLSGIDVTLVQRGDWETEAEPGYIQYMQSGRIQKTASDGTYSFDDLTPGDYSIVIYPVAPSEKSPYLPVFYPAKSSLSDATVLHLTTTATLDNINLVRPAALPLATIHIRVLRKDGSPIENALIKISDAAPVKIEIPFISGITDTSGRADLHLLATHEYTLTANTPGPCYLYTHDKFNGVVTLVNDPNPQEQPNCAGPVKFIAKDEFTLAPLTPNKHDADCSPAPPPSPPPAPAAPASCPVKPLP